MVALRGRFTAITFVALMVAAGFASMVPTAAADHLVINSVAVKIFVEGQERTSADPGGVVVLNQQVRLRVEADISASCASTVPGAVEVQVFTSANLSSFGDFSNRTPIPGDSTLRTPYIAEHVFQLALLPNGTNNVTNPFDVFIEVACQLVGTDEDVPGGGTTEPAERTRAQATAPAIRYDNVAPVLTIAPGVGAGTYRIGQSVPLNVLANVSSDLAGYTIDYSQLTRSVGVNGIVSGTVAANGVPISRTITIEDTGIESATVVGTLTDDRGYTGLVYFAPRIPPTPTHTFDARRPALASAVLEPKFTNATQFTFTPDESHAQNSDLVNYSVRFSNATSAFSVDCLKSATAPGCARISPGVYNVTDTRLTANEAYTVTLLAFDDAGNEALPVVTRALTTAPFLRGIVEYALDQVTPSTPGRIGSVVNLSLMETDLTNVSRVIVDASTFGVATPLVWDNTPGKMFNENLSFVVGDGQETPTLTAVAYGPSGAGQNSTEIDVRGFEDGDEPSVDAERPAAPTGLELTALPNGTVRLGFTVPSDSDLSGYNVTFQKVAGGTTTTVPFGKDTEEDVHLPPFFITHDFDFNNDYEFRIYPSDDVGNPASPPAIGITRPTSLPIGGTVDAMIPSQTFPATVTGTWLAVDGLAEYTTGNIMLAVNDSDGEYWNPESGEFQSDFVAANASFNPPSGTSGTWSAGNFSALDPMLPNGNYTYTVVIKNTQSGVEGISRSIFLHDRVAPNLLPTATWRNKFTVDPSAGAMQGQGLVVNLAANDSGGIGTINYTLVQTTSPFRSAVGLDGADLTINCPGTGCTIPGYTVGRTQPYDDNVTLRFQNVPLGSYRLNVTVADRAGNARLPVQLDKTVAVVPRVAIAEGLDTPSVGPDNQVRLRAYAAWEGVEAFDSNGQPLGACPAPDRVCRVAKVEFFARVGDTGDGTAFGTAQFIPVAGPDNTLDPTSTTKYYNYTPSESFSLGALDRSNAYVRAVATARTSADAEDVVARTPWIRIRTTDAPGGLQVVNPPVDGGTFMSTTGVNRTLNFSVTLDQAGVSQAPVLNYTIRNSAGQYVDINSSASPSATPPFVRTSLTRTVGSTYTYNWSNNFTLAPGQYFLNVTTTSSAGVSNVSRRFTVESAAPSFISVTGASDMFDGKYVRQEFNASVNVSHGFATVNASGLTVSLVDAQGNIVPDANREISVQLQDRAAGALPNESTYLLRVRLPGVSTETARFDLRFNLTTEATRTCGGCRDASTLLAYPVILDAGPGDTGVFLDLTQGSGTLLGSPLNVTGFAQDAGTGIALLEVRIVNLSANSTFDPAFRSFRPGIGEHWLRNDSAPSDRFVTIIPKGRLSSGVEVADWTIDGGTGPTQVKFDRGSSYVIESRVTDKAGFVSTLRSTTIRFDSIAPTLDGFRFSGGASASTVNYHGAGKFHVDATDNACVGRVVLNVTRGDGTLGEANFTRPAGAVCSATAGNTTASWEIDLAQNPSMTDFVGLNRYAVEAFDPAGNRLLLSRTINLTVRDTTPPTVNQILFEPVTAGAGLPATVVADIFENDNISRVEATVAFANTPSTILARGNLTPRDVTRTGTGLWEGRISTIEGSAVNLTLERGDYVISVRAIDINSAVTCPGGACAFSHAILRVVDGAPPQIIARGPTTPVVNATPTFRYEVLDLGVTTAGIRLHTGFEDNLSEVAREELNFSELKAANGTGLGYELRYVPAEALAEGENFTVRLSVTSASSGFSNTHTSNFTVDATAPNVTANVTGDVTLNGTRYATSATRVEITAADELTPPVIKYAVGGGAEQTYNGPLTPSGRDGEWALEYWALDAAGNAAPKQTIVLALDTTGPRIAIAQHGDEVLLTAADEGAGLNETSVTVHYRYGDAVSYSTRVAEKGVGTYRTLLPGNATEEGLRYYVTAEDVLGNVGTNYSASAPYHIPKDATEVGNLPPTVRVTQPVQGASVRGTIDIRWLAEDPEGAPLSISIALREPAPGRVLSAAGENSGTFPLNLTGLARGNYTIVVTASDGENSVSAQVSFTVEEAITPERVPSGQIAGNTEVSVSVGIETSGKIVAQATYRLMRDGSVAQQGRLAPNQGLYSASFTPTEPGNYAVVVEVLYTDGTSETPKQVSTFTVQGVAQPPVEGTRSALPSSLMVLVAVALLTVALAAYGAFGRWRK